MKISGISKAFLTVLALGFFSPIAYAGGVEYPRSVNFMLGSNIDLTFSSGSSADSVSINASSVIITISGKDTFKIRSSDKYELGNDAGIVFVCKDNYSELIISGDRTVVVTPVAKRCIPPSDVVPVEPPSPAPDSTVSPQTDPTDPDNSPMPTPVNAKVQDVLSELARVQAELESLDKNRTPICGYMRNLSYGSNGDDVATLQKELIVGEFLDVVPTGYFGAKTKLGVSAWQAANGISPASGYFGAISRGKIQGDAIINDSVSCVTRDLKLGDQGEDVLTLQNFLKSQGSDIYPEGLTTGQFQNLTRLALQRFQAKWGIATANDPGYGMFGPKTRAKISAMNQ